MSKPRPDVEVVSFEDDVPAAPTEKVEAVETETVAAPAEAEAAAATSEAIPVVEVVASEETAAAVAVQEPPAAPVEAPVEVETVAEEKPAEPPKSSEQLKRLREEIEANTKKTLSDLGQQIADAERREMQERDDALIKQFVPTLDKDQLRGRDFVFLIQKTKDMGDEKLQSPLGATLSVATDVFWALRNVPGVTVTAKFWGSTVGNMQDVKLNDTRGYTGAKEIGRDFLSAAQELAKAPANPDRITHYIVVSSGDISTDAEGVLRKHTTAALNAAAYRKDAKATFDFVIVNPAETEMSSLVRTWSSSVKPANTVQVADGADLRNAVLKVLKARVADTSYVAPPLPKPVVAEPPKPVEAVVETPPVETVAETPAVEAKPVEAAKTPGKIRSAFNRVFGRGKKATPAPADAAATAPQPEAAAAPGKAESQQTAPAGKAAATPSPAK